MAGASRAVKLSIRAIRFNKMLSVKDQRMSLLARGCESKAVRDSLMSGIDEREEYEEFSRSTHTANQSMVAKAQQSNRPSTIGKQYNF